MFPSPQMDVAAERAVLAGICNFHSQAYFDVCDIIKPESFSLDSNQKIYQCFQHLFAKDSGAKVDYLTIVSSANEIGLRPFFEQRDEQNYLRAVLNSTVKYENVRANAIKIRKLHVAKIIIEQQKESIHLVSSINGTETFQEIISLAEKPIFDLSNLINEQGVEPIQRLGEGAEEYVVDLMDNPREILGIPSSFTHWDISIGGGLQEEEVDIVAARLKGAKALKNGSKVYCPDGYKNIEELKIGDIVCTPDGKTANIIGVWPQGEKEIFKITFSDGTFSECDKGHLWKIKGYKNKDYKISNIEYLLNERLRLDSGGKQHRFNIPTTDIVNFSRQSITIPPYILGVLLGDGCIKQKACFSCADSEIANRVSKILELNYSDLELQKYTDDITFNIKNKQNSNSNIIINQLRELKLLGKGSHTKFIPKNYIYNTKDIRLDLVRGLMDTDGTTKGGSRASYTTVSLQLANDIKEILESLGYIVKMFEKFSSHSKNGKKFKSYYLNIIGNNLKELFYLSRKVDKVTVRKKKPVTRKIDKIEYIGKSLATCITIDSLDGLFLTNNFIVTHNSFFGDCVGNFVSGQLKLPVLNVDTEMSKKQHVWRVLANIAGIKIDDIKSGKCGKNEEERYKLIQAARSLKENPYYYESVGGLSFEDTLSVIRRWIVKEVGLNEFGYAKPALIVFDYFKTMDAEELSDNMREYQLLGFKLMKLKDLCKKYKIACLALAQTSREGITKEDTGVIGDSDRIARYASSITLLKDKSDEEIQMDGPKAGNKKLVVLASRNGPGLEPKDYINIDFNGAYGKMVEGKTHFELQRAKTTNKAFETDQEIPPI